jgi:hypothetical protein
MNAAAMRREIGEATKLILEIFTDIIELRERHETSLLERL